MSQVFKPIPNFPGYKVSKNGTVIGPDGNKLSPREDFDGYMRVDLRRNKRRYTRFIHTLVASAWHGSSGQETDHLDRDKTNNHASNLEPVSKAENLRRRKF